MVIAVFDQCEEMTDQRRLDDDGKRFYIPGKQG